LYARHGIPELWIVDLPGGRIHFYRAPAKGKYTSVSSSADPGLTPIASLPGAAVDLAPLAQH
jgi:Uma2 family endonuclease